MSPEHSSPSPALTDMPARLTKDQKAHLLEMVDNHFHKMNHSWLVRVNGKPREGVKEPAEVTRARR